MSNVIIFPGPREKKQALAQRTGSKTLFLHVKNATMIVHLSNFAADAATGERVVKS